MQSLLMSLSSRNIHLFARHLSVVANTVRHEKNIPSRLGLCMIPTRLYQPRSTPRYQTRQKPAESMQSDDEYRVFRETLIYVDDSSQKYFTLMKLLGYLSLVFFINLADVVKLQLKKLETPKQRRSGWSESIYREQSVQTFFMCLSLVLGIAVPVGLWTIASRSIHRIWLMTGGKTVKIDTFAPWMMTRTLEVPVDHVCGLTSRFEIKHVKLSVKIPSGSVKRFTMNNAGEFVHPRIFDTYIAVHRNLKN